ncbi:MAG: hypothetical protein ABJG41_20310 [Cyclobacteriaceae bacterium]
MKISNILIATLIIFSAACGTKSDHGHEHSTEAHDHPHDSETNAHDHEDHIEQEEFTVDGDSIEVMTDSTAHTHDDGSSHHDH